MSYKTLLFSFLAALFICIVGCGGDGVNSEQADPNGAFAMSMTPSSDGAVGKQFAVELQVEGGEITSAFARHVNSDFFGQSTTDVSGSASEGFIDLVAVFSGFTVEVEAEFSGLSWHGSYRRRVDKLVVEEGDLEITRGDSTANVIGTYQGDIDVDGILFAADLSFEQKGNLIAIDGTIEGEPIDGFGNVIGRSTYYEVIFEADSTGWLFLGNVNSDITRMTGQGRQPLAFTFDFEKVPPKP